MMPNAMNDHTKKLVLSSAPRPLKLQLLLLRLCLTSVLVSGWCFPAPSLFSQRTRRNGEESSCRRHSNIATPPLGMATGRGKKAQQRKVDDFVDFMNRPLPEPVVDSSDVAAGPPGEDDLADFVRCIARAADMRKAEDINAIRVSKLTAMTSFIVVVSGNSRPQNQAIAASIADEVEENHDGRRPGGSVGVPEGTADSGWILLDYGDVMVHVMTPRSRLFYDVEGRWNEGEVMDLSDVLVPNTAVPKDSSSSSAGGPGGVAEEDDPFWS